MRLIEGHIFYRKMYSYGMQTLLARRALLRWNCRFPKISLPILASPRIVCYTITRCRTGSPPSFIIYTRIIDRSATMSANHSLILFEGDVTRNFAGIFDCFGLKFTGDIERATGLAEIWECTGWPRKGKPRNHIHKAALYNGMWTAVLDREMTMILNQEQCAKCAERCKIKVFGYMIESVTGSCVMYYFAPQKVRGLNIQNFEVLEDFGEPLPQEEGVSAEEMLSDGAMRISRRIGFSDSLFAHPTSKVQILALEDPQREAADQERSAILAAQHRTGTQSPQKPESRPEKPWWKLW